MKNRNKLLEEILNEMPSDLTEIEKAAFIMKKIAEERSFSSKYYWSDSSVRNAMYNNAIKNNIKDQNKRQIICVTATKLFMYIAEKVGLDTYAIGDTQITKSDFSIYKCGEHVSPVLKTKDEKYIKCDVEWNLENIQTVRRWTKFGTKDEGQDILHEIPQDEIDKIMKKIGYINNKEEYLEEYINRTGIFSQEKSLKEKIELLFKDNEISKRVSKLKSSVDIYRFYRNIIKEYIDKDGMVNIFGAYAKNRKRRRYSLITHLKNEEDEILWIWSNKQKQMIEVDPNTLKGFIQKTFLKIIPGKKKDKYDSLINTINRCNLYKTLEMDLQREAWIR